MASLLKNGLFANLTHWDSMDLTMGALTALYCVGAEGVYRWKPRLTSLWSRRSLPALPEATPTDSDLYILVGDGIRDMVLALDTQRVLHIDTTSCKMRFCAFADCRLAAHAAEGKWSAIGDGVAMFASTVKLLVLQMICSDAALAVNVLKTDTSQLATTFTPFLAAVRTVSNQATHATDAVEPTPTTAMGVFPKENALYTSMQYLKKTPTNDPSIIPELVTSILNSINEKWSFGTTVWASSSVPGVYDLHYDLPSAAAAQRV